MNHQHAAYQTAAQMGVRKTRQIVMLYDGVLKFIRQGKQAIENDDIQTRYNALTRACDIINGLQLSLDMDNGGEIAQLLYDYYAGLDMRLISVHQSNDLKMLDACIGHVEMMREAWEEIDHKESEKTQDQQHEGSIYDPSLKEKIAASEQMDEAGDEDVSEPEGSVDETPSTPQASGNNASPYPQSPEDNNGGITIHV